MNHNHPQCKTMTGTQKDASPRKSSSCRRLRRRLWSCLDDVHPFLNCASISCHSFVHQETGLFLHNVWKHLIIVIVILIQIFRLKIMANWCSSPTSASPVDWLVCKKKKTNRRSRRKPPGNGDGDGRWCQPEKMRDRVHRRSYPVAFFRLSKE